MSSSRASVTIAVDRPDEAFAALRRMIEQHGLEPCPAGPDAVRYRFEESEAVVHRGTGSLGIRLATGDPGTLYFLKETAEAYLAEIDPSCAAALDWSHDGAAPTAPGFRELTLRRMAEVYPGLRRFTFSAEDLRPFAAGGLHVRLLVPPSQARPARWPAPGPEGGLIWPPEPDRPAVRAYTLRHVRPGARGPAGEVDIDVLVHGPEALAGWAASARPGARLAMLGPGGGDVPPDGRWLLLGGDETALPALARIIEARPRAGGRCVVCARPEAAGYLPQAAGIALTILHPGRHDAMTDLLRAVELPPGEAPFIWFAGERAPARALRAHFRGLPGLGPEDISISSYWRSGGHDAAHEPGRAAEPIPDAH